MLTPTLLPALVNISSKPTFPDQSVFGDEENREISRKLAELRDRWMRTYLTGQPPTVMREAISDVSAFAVRQLNKVLHYGYGIRTDDITKFMTPEGESIFQLRPGDTNLVKGLLQFGNTSLQMERGAIRPGRNEQNETLERQMTNVIAARRPYWPSY